MLFGIRYWKWVLICPEGITISNSEDKGESMCNCISYKQERTEQGFKRATCVRCMYLLTLISISSVTLCQDLEKLNFQKPIMIHGRISASMNFSKSSGGYLSRDPFQYFLSSNLNISVAGLIELPFSGNISSGNRTFNQPSFKQFGLSPHYKGLTVHLGYRNMTFSPYSLSGLTFFGTGMEYTGLKGKVKLGLMSGRFRKENKNKTAGYYDPLGYERRGLGASLSIGSMSSNIGLTVFKAWDKVKDLILLDSGYLSPAENMVAGINLSQKFGKIFTISADYTLSTIKQKTMLHAHETPFASAADSTEMFSKSSRKAGAYSVKMEVLLGKLNAGILIKRIDPGFESFGCTFISNDVQNYLVDLSLTAFGSKVSLAGQFGFERTNLENLQMSTAKRAIGMLNANLVITKYITSSLNYSNFSNESVPVMVHLQDSFRNMQTTRSFGSIIQINIPGRIRNFSTGINLNWQHGTSLNYYATERIDDLNKLFLFSLLNRITMVPWQASFSGGANYSSVTMEDRRLNNISITAGISKEMLASKLSLCLDHSYLITSEPGLKQGMQADRITIAYKTMRSGTLTLSSSTRFSCKAGSKAENKPGFESISLLSYRYSF